MPFVEMIEFPALHDIKPGRLYVHQAGHQLFLGLCEDNYVPAVNYVLEILGEKIDLFKPADFVLPILWGDANTPVAEIFGYGDMREWPGNPTVYNWVFRNGVHMPEERQISCGDTIVLLGIEENHRRNSRNLEEYIMNPPELPAGLLI